jgi:transcriptional regulator with XRE-family HTH domain
VSEDWAAVAKAINERVAELGWRQRELAERSHVSLATVREIQRQTVERRRSPRTLESLSEVLNGVGSPRAGRPVTGSDEALSPRLDTLERRLDEITQLLVDMKTDLSVVIEHVRKDR